ncbi:hypothetical protein FOA52_009380 [Chlamydomonas sp. UWO 241]|nr:hypothetical protein FOA52_009380 [Chlamydomonas sp. UWO 241]
MHPNPTPEAPEASCSGTVSALASELEIEEAQASWFTRHRPELLHRPPDRLRKRLAGLAQLLGCTTVQVANMIHRQPELLDLDAATIRRRLAVLTEALGATWAGRAAARRVPLLLVSEAVDGGLHGQLAALVTNFHLDGLDDAVRLASKEPLVLVMDPKEVHSRLRAQMQVFTDMGSSKKSTSAMYARCAANPWLVTVSTASLVSKLANIGRTLGLMAPACQYLAVSYPEILQQSESGLAAKVALLLEAIPRERLQTMVFREPSLLCRSAAKIIASLRTVREATSMSSSDVAVVLDRRPAILAKSAISSSRCYRALSIWRMTQDEKHALIREHPLLLQLSPREVHFRCRWLRSLMESNGFYHSALRRLPPQVLGSMILHLPATWSRLQYLVDSNREGVVPLTDAIERTDRAFATRFPEYRQWLQYKTSAMGAKVPWRVPKRASGPTEGGDTTLMQAALSERRQASADASSSAAAAVAGAASSSGRPAGDSGGVRPGGSSEAVHMVAVVSEASTLYYGLQKLSKPGRVLNMAEAAELAGSVQPVVSGPSSSHEHQAAPSPAHLLSNFPIWQGRSGREAEQMLQDAAARIEVSKASSAAYADISPYLHHVAVWETKHIRMLSHLCGLTYKPNMMQDTKLKRLHNLDLIASSLASRPASSQDDGYRSGSEDAARADADGMVALPAGMQEAMQDAVGRGRQAAPGGSGRGPPGTSTSGGGTPRAGGTIRFNEPGGAADARVVEVTGSFDPDAGDGMAVPPAPAPWSPPSASTPGGGKKWSPPPAVGEFAGSINAAGAAAASAASYAASSVYAGLMALQTKQRGGGSSASSGGSSASGSGSSVGDGGEYDSSRQTVSLGQAMLAGSLAAEAIAEAQEADKRRKAAAEGGGVKGGRSVLRAQTAGTSAAAEAMQYSTSPTCPSEWFVADDPAQQTRVFVIQGSDTIDHWRLNLTFDPVVFEDPKFGVTVHRGVYAAALVLYDLFLPLIKEHLASSRVARVTFTGHSIGGCIGQLLMLMYRARGVLSVSQIATVYTFGAPSVFNECASKDWLSDGYSDAGGKDGGRHQDLTGGAHSLVEGLSPDTPYHMGGPSRLLSALGLRESAVRNVIMHRDIVPRAFSCDYSLVSEMLKSWGASYKAHTPLSLPQRKHLYYFIGRMIVLQPDSTQAFVQNDPEHPMLPQGPGLYYLAEPRDVPLGEPASGARGGAAAASGTSASGAGGGAGAAAVQQQQEEMPQPGGGLPVRPSGRAARWWSAPAADAQPGMAAPRPAAAAEEEQASARAVWSRASGGSSNIVSGGGGRGKQGGKLAAAAPAAGGKGSAPSASSSRARGGSAPAGRARGPVPASARDALMELMDTPHPLQTLADPGAYLMSGSISRYHNPDHYTMSFGRIVHLRRKVEGVSPGMPAPRPRGVRAPEPVGAGSASWDYSDDPALGRAAAAAWGEDANTP